MERYINYNVHNISSRVQVQAMNQIKLIKLAYALLLAVQFLEAYIAAMFTPMELKTIRRCPHVPRIRVENFIKIALMVPEIWSHTDFTEILIHQKCIFADSS